jgi:hypothetical protein
LQVVMKLLQKLLALKVEFFGPWQLRKNAGLA